MTDSAPDLLIGQLADILRRETHRASAEGVHDATHHALLFRGLVRDRVGGFFGNAYAPGTPDICSVCRGPADQDLCGRCQAAQEAHGDLLADRTILLTYALGNREGARHQSAHHMLTYKGYRGTPPVPRCAEDLQLMISVMMDMHRSCLQSWLGTQWDSLTFVPSKERPNGTHPVAALANAALPTFAPAPKLQKFLLTPGRGSDSKHEMTSDRYEIDQRWRKRVEGRNVLIVDDTWTTGASAQGAAVAAKRAGAATVTLLCVARWLRWDWGDHKKLISTLHDGFDVLRCPVTGHPCRTSAQFTVSRANR
ncbi:hypothetical protein [Nocardia anaemiae]|uniref:hypothetical protein n=1 Tax=Nocardia anaemiae TaxID=263910 RepID=UPI0007A4C405|nr:hypothetical protein [Nocardia anaemiae]